MGCSVSAVSAKAFGKRNAKDTGSTMTTKREIIEFDSRLPLTIRQRFEIAKSWKTICRDIERTGTTMFLRMFETNADVRRLFKVLDGRDIAELASSGILENHVRMVMYTIDEAISSLDDVDTVTHMLNELGRWHMNKSGFQPEILWNIEQPFLMAVKQTLGARYTSTMKHIYSKVIRFILETLIAGCRKGALENGPVKDVIKKQTT